MVRRRKQKTEKDKGKVGSRARRGRCKTCRCKPCKCGEDIHCYQITCSTKKKKKSPKKKALSKKKAQAKKAKKTKKAMY